MSELSFLDSIKKTNKIPSCFLLSHFFFIFLSSLFLMLLYFFYPLLLTTFFLVLLFPPILDHGYNDNYDNTSPSSVSKLSFLLSVVESLARKVFSFENYERDEGTWFFEELQAYLDVFRETEFEDVLNGSCSESCFSGEREKEGGESKAHVGPMENKPNGNCDQNPFGEKGDDNDIVEDARLVADESMICVYLEEYLSESGNYYYSGNYGWESRNHVGLHENVPSVDFDENPIEKDEGKLEGEMSKFCEEESNDFSVDLVEDSMVNLEGKPGGKEDDGDVDKVVKNTKQNDMFCQKIDKEVKPLVTDFNKGQESKDKMALRSGSKVMCNDAVIDATEDAKEEYFGTPERYLYWDYKRSYGSMRKEKEWRRTLAFKLYEEKINNVEVGISSGIKNDEAMDLLWATYDDIELDKVKERTKNVAKDEEEDEDDEDEDEEDKEEKVKGMESKYCCLQALNLSSGKVNLGMRKPSLVKISKALKSIGFFHHVSKHGRKKTR